MNRPLRIGLVAPVWLPVPPDTYGGTEAVVALLYRRYVEAGHDVVLFATGDSTVSREAVRSVTARGLIEHMAAGEALAYEHYVNALAAEVVGSSRGFDVIHSHLGLAQLPALSLAACPVVQTLHTPLDIDDCWIAGRYPGVEMVALTHAQAKRLSRPVTVVPSGLDLGEYPATKSAGPHLAFLGRMGPGKNPLGAIQVAASSGRPIVLAGAPQNREERDYFRTEIEPLIDGDSVRYLGPVDHPAKTRLLSDACAMLFPIVADEAFGLVMIEAMACGTPIVARGHSSVPEIVDEGVTGFYADDLDELSSLVDDAAALDRAAIRRRTEERFSYQRMGDRYLSLFEGLV
ncbi:MAG: glycosyltransferase family 4 protein [Acidimicrobiales bacterium]